MIIYSSVLIENPDSVRIQASYETGLDKGTLWYDFPLEYKDYLVLENSDAFFVGLLLLAMKRGENLYIKNKVSEKLLYNVTTYLIPALILSSSEFKSIEIIVDELNVENLNIYKATATGSSCGIDSTATIIDHLDLKNSYSLNYLTYLNAGSHGTWNGKITQNTYDNRLKKVREFSSELKLPLIEINTNIGEILGNDFQKAHSLRNLSCILNLQKLIKTYYYASAYRFDFFKLDKNDTSSWDILITKFLSTESIDFISSMSQLNRIDRTKIVAEFKPAHRFLDVCTSPDLQGKINCSRCDKCMRTQLTLDVLEKLDTFNMVFNIAEYSKLKKRFIGKVIATRKKNHINLELYDYLVLNNKLTLYHYFQSVKYKINLFKSNLFKEIKKYLKKSV